MLAEPREDKPHEIVVPRTFLGKWQQRFPVLLYLEDRVRNMVVNRPDARHIPLLEQVRGVPGGTWAVAAILSILVLNRFLSPIVTSLALTPVIAPVAALSLIIVGEFDFTKLQTLISGSAGIVLSTMGVVLLVLFVQNVLKLAGLFQSFLSPEHKGLRNHALAGVFAPLATAGVWSIFVWLGYFIHAKNVVLAMIMIFAGKVASQVLQDIQWSTAVSTDQLAVAANIMSDSLRVALGLTLMFHLWLVWRSYKLVYWQLERTLDFFTDHSGKILDFFRENREVLVEIIINCSKVLGVLFALLIFLWGGSALTEIEVSEQNAWKTWCANNHTYARAEGKYYVLVEAGSGGVNPKPSQCIGEPLTPLLRLGEKYSVGHLYRGTLVIADQGGYKKKGQCAVLPSDRDAFGVQMGESCRLDLRVDRNERYWEELPGGLSQTLK